MFHFRKPKKHKVQLPRRVSGYIVMSRCRFNSALHKGVLELVGSGRQVCFDSFEAARRFTDERDYMSFIVAKFQLDEDKITRHCGDIFEYNYDIDVDECFDGFWEVN